MNDIFKAIYLSFMDNGGEDEWGSKYFEIKWNKMTNNMSIEEWSRYAKYRKSLIG